MAILNTIDGGTLQVDLPKREPDTLPERPAPLHLEKMLDDECTHDAEAVIRAELAHLRAELVQKDLRIASQSEELAARMAEILQLREAVGVLREAAQEAQTLARQEVHAELMKLRMEVDDMREELAGHASETKDLRAWAIDYGAAMAAWLRGDGTGDKVGDARFGLLKCAEAYGTPAAEAEEEAQDEHAHTY